MFADVLNKSGALEGYCSGDTDDIAVGSLGSWAQIENEISAQLAIRHSKQRSSRA